VTAGETLVFRAAELADLTEAPLGPPSAEPLSGVVTTRASVSFQGLDRRVLCGMWECEPGLSRWEFLERGEFIHVLSGRMTVTRDGRDGVELTAGCSAVFDLGWTGTWEVHETLRKVFTVFRP
jgi:uncharacterized cupin superfamily protein